MALELQVVHTSSGTLYARVRRQSDLYVWYTTTPAFEAYNAAHLSAYSIALTDQGGNVFAGDFPAAIDAGSYLVQYYVQGGGSPAADDLEIKSRYVTWNGTSLSDVDLSAYALTTLASVKRRLEITDDGDDTLISELINAVSAEIERITGVNFKARDYRKWLNGAHQRELLLPHYPVQHVTRIAFGAANALSVSFTGTGIRANVSIYRDPESPDAGGLRLTSYSIVGAKTTTDLTFAAYPSVSTLVAAVAAVSGWTASVLHNVPSADLHPTGGQDAMGVTVTFTYPDRDDFAYSVNHGNGKVRFDTYAGSGAWPWWSGEGRYGHAHDIRMPRAFQHILVEFRGGYEEIPTDVSLVCNEIVSDKYFEGQTGRGVTELRLGPGLIKLAQSEIDDVRESLKHYIDLSNLIGEA